ncbi:MAG: hypothetical protein JWQ57_1176 [Mucilaginibacter sp.]|nr:hypothetical protein [Mucilaginibacter sp.]
MDKRHRKFFYAFLLLNCFLSPACNEKHNAPVVSIHHTKPAKNSVIKASN